MWTDRPMTRSDTSTPCTVPRSTAQARMDSQVPRSGSRPTQHGQIALQLHTSSRRPSTSNVVPWVVPVTAEPPFARRHEAAGYMCVYRTATAGGIRGIPYPPRAQGSPWFGQTLAHCPGGHLRAVVRTHFGHHVLEVHFS